MRDRFSAQRRALLSLAASVAAGAVAAATVTVATADSGGGKQAPARVARLGARIADDVSASWPEYRFGPTRTSYNPNEHILSPDTVGHLRLQWVAQTNRFDDASPVVADGIAYTGSQDGIFRAVDQRTGRTIWSAARGEVENTSAAVDNGVVYYLGVNYLWARDARTGEVRWFAPISHQLHDFSSPAVVDGTVYIDGDSSLNAYNAQTGALLWTQPVQSPTPAQNHGGAPGSSPAVSDGIVYFGAVDGVHAFNASDGSPRWTFTMGATTVPAVANGLVYAVAAGELVALDAQTGAESWSYHNPNLLHSSPAVADGHVFIGTFADNDLSNNGDLVELDAATGAPGWTFHTHGELNYTSPTVANGVVYVASRDDTVYALSEASGHELWSYSTFAQMEASPTVVGGMLFVSSDDYNTYAFGLGEPAKQAPPMPAACATWNSIYQLSQLPVIQEVRISDGACRFRYQPGDTYSGQGTFTIICSDGGGPFTTPGFDLPLTGCRGDVSILMGYPGRNPHSTVVAGAAPVKPTPCATACLSAVQTQVVPLLAETGQ